MKGNDPTYLQELGIKKTEAESESETETEIQ